MLSAQSYKQDAYTKEDRDLLELLATHAAIAIENARLFATVQQMADTDPLTGLLTRRKFYELAEREFARAEENQSPLSVMVVDIDNFKKINDEFGHRMGDEVLQKITHKLKSSLRGRDILCRYGGEEFVILLPYTEQATACHVAERLRQLTEQIDLNDVKNSLNRAANSKLRDEAIRVTTSIGIARYSETCANLDTLIDHADHAMYAAKNDGRNCVRTFQEEG
jgi:diguanylate cyclase (GGDEF)-like protein